MNKITKLILSLFLIPTLLLADDFGSIPSNLNIGASQSVRRNAGDSAFEAWTVGTLATQSGTFSGTSSGTNTGDVTLTGTPDYITISGQAITRGQIDLATDVTGDLPFANIAQITTDRLLGRDTAGTGDIEQLTVGGGVEFTGTGIQRSALTGDVTASAGSNSTTIANDAVTLAKMANMATSSLIYRKTGGTGDPEVNTLATLKTDLGLSGTNTGDQSLAGLVPYTGATTNVDLGANNLTSTRLFTGLGTVSAPAYSFTGDTNTGLWSPTGDTLALSTNGSESARLTTTGLGIGVTSPSAILDLKASTTSVPSIRIRSGTAPSVANDGDLWYDGSKIAGNIGGTMFLSGQNSGDQAMFSTIAVSGQSDVVPDPGNPNDTLNLVAGSNVTITTDASTDSITLNATGGSGSIPSGLISMYGSNTPPAGWLLCNGAAVNRITYAGLFSAIGTTYGVGDGSTTFNLPNFQQRFPLGKASSGTGSTLGNTGGAIDHNHTNPAHYHNTRATGATVNITSSGSGTSGNNSVNHTHSGTTDTGTFGTLPGQGASAAGNTNRILRASAAGSANNTFDGASPLHTHGFTTGVNSANHTHSTPNHTHANSAFNGLVGLVTGGVDGDATMTSGNNNPPFLVINFIIKE